MAKIFIIFLIALLPLRGWSTDRMVLQMDRGGQTVGIANDMAGMATDCAMAMQMDSQAHGVDSDNSAVHEGCQSCQLCMPLATMDAPVTLSSTPIVQAVPEPRTGVFVSADTVRHAKPPIS